MSHDTPIHVLALGGSLRCASHTRALLRAAQALAPDGVEITLYRGLVDIPPYDQDRDLDTPPAMVRDCETPSRMPTRCCCPRRSTTRRSPAS
jgi:hypothetical protein